MLWPDAGLRRARNVEIQNRVADARRRHPESEAWLQLLEAALAEGEDGTTWEAAVPAAPAPDRPVKAPLLYHAHIAVDERATRRWVRRLAARAKVGQVDAVALLEAGLCQDTVDLAPLRVVAQMAAIPLLQACARRLSGEVPASWWEGYCPLCGAWPVLAEYVGLERKRQLRCGRCGTGWTLPMLRCVFCDETDHEQLGYLAPDGDEEMRKVEVCKTCKGYVKGLATVRSLAPWAILLDDLGTVHLDVVAIERGYERPERPGYALECKVVEAGA
jgi:FdhE protein